MKKEALVVAVILILVTLIVNFAQAQIYCGLAPLAPPGCHMVCLGGTWVPVCGYR